MKNIKIIVYKETLSDEISHAISGMIVKHFNVQTKLFKHNLAPRVIVVAGAAGVGRLFIAEKVKERLEQSNLLAAKNILIVDTVEGQVIPRRFDGTLIVCRQLSNNETAGYMMDLLKEVVEA
jgi:hypothetical protein